jgi:hypothetical protein
MRGGILRLAESAVRDSGGVGTGPPFGGVPFDGPGSTGTALPDPPPVPVVEAFPPVGEFPAPDALPPPVAEDPFPVG